MLADADEARVDRAAIPVVAVDRRAHACAVLALPIDEARIAGVARAVERCLDAPPADQRTALHRPAWVHGTPATDVSRGTRAGDRSTRTAAAGRVSSSGLEQNQTASDDER